MVTSYILSSTFVPVMSVWLLRHSGAGGGNQSSQPKDHEEREDHKSPGWFSLARLQEGYAGLLHGVLRVRWLVLLLYLLVPAGLVGWWVLGHPGLGTEIFPEVDAGQFQLRLRAPDGTLLEDTEALAKDVLTEIGRLAGDPKKVQKSVTLVGTASYNYPINAIYLWTAGPHEAVLKVQLRRGSGIRIKEFKKRLRAELPRLERQRAPRMQDVHLSFDPGDIVEEVMSFGAPTPVEVSVNGPRLANNLAHAEKIREQLARIPSLRDLQYGQSLKYPTIDVTVDRERAGLSGITAVDVGRTLSPATLSSRFVTPLFWRDPKSGVGYQVQVEVQQQKMNSIREIEQLPIRSDERGVLRVEDVARVSPGSMPGQIDRYNMKRVISLTANIEGEDLGRVADRLDKAIQAAGTPEDVAIKVDPRGQIVPMRQMFWGLGVGLGMAVVVILLLLTAYFQSVRLALVVVSTSPAVLAGVVLALVATGTTLNIQSFMGSIMAIGVAVANAILLASFAEENRVRLAGAERDNQRSSGEERGHQPVKGHAEEAVVEGAKHRLRPILMTSCAMIAGMIPMAWGWGEGGEQTAPLGRAVIGGLLIATFATLFILPTIFAVVQGRSSTQSASLDPDDPESSHFDQDGAQSAGQANVNRPRENRRGRTEDIQTGGE
jgi:multidrug efflux pump subunit AcrB